MTRKTSCVPLTRTAARSYFSCPNARTRLPRLRCEPLACRLLVASVSQCLFRECLVCACGRTPLCAGTPRGKGGAHQRRRCAFAGTLQAEFHGVVQERDTLRSEADRRALEVADLEGRLVAVHEDARREAARAEGMAAAQDGARKDADRLVQEKREADEECQSLRRRLADAEAKAESAVRDCERSQGVTCALVTRVVACVRHRLTRSRVCHSICGTHALRGRCAF